jgi:hypothetical protein
MSTEKCPHCQTVISSSATVCRGCGAVKRVTYDTSTFGYVKGYVGAAVAAVILGSIIGFLFNVALGWITGIVTGLICAYLVSQNGARVEYWDRG